MQKDSWRERERERERECREIKVGMGRRWERSGLAALGLAGERVRRSTGTEILPTG